MAVIGAMSKSGRWLGRSTGITICRLAVFFRQSYPLRMQRQPLTRLIQVILFQLLAVTFPLARALCCRVPGTSAEAITFGTGRFLFQFLRGVTF